MYVDDATLEDDVAEANPKPIHVEESSPEPPSIKKKPRNPGIGARKIPASTKVASTPKA